MKRNSSKKTKTTRASRVPRNMSSRMSQGRGDNTIHTVTKSIDQSTSLTSTVSAPGLYAFQFALSHLSEYTSFTSIYDQYRFDFAEIMILPMTIPSATSSSTVPFANLVIVSDYDDAATLANWALHLNYENATIVSPGKRHTRTIVPRCAGATIVSSTAVSALNLSRQWIDCSQPSVPHFGFKIGVQQSTSSNLTVWYPYFKYTISFRNIR